MWQIYFVHNPVFLPLFLFRYKILPIGVGGGWKTEHLLDIASDTNNIYLEKDMHFLSPTFTHDINEKITSLLQNPGTKIKNNF